MNHCFCSALSSVTYPPYQSSRLRNTGEHVAVYMLPSSAAQDGTSGAPQQSIVLPLPDMNTASLALDSCSRCLIDPRAGSALNAGGSRSLMHNSGCIPCDCIELSSSGGSGPGSSSPGCRPRDLKISGVDKPSFGFTRIMFCEWRKGGSTNFTISPRPVQYAAPLEKNTAVSEPSSLAQLCERDNAAGLSYRQQGRDSKVRGQ